MHNKKEFKEAVTTVLIEALGFVLREIGSALLASKYKNGVTETKAYRCEDKINTCEMD